MQKVGVYVNLGAYYIIGLPLAIFLAFVLHQNGKVTNYYTKVLVVNMYRTLDITRVVTGPVDWNHRRKQSSSCHTNRNYIANRLGATSTVIRTL